jgi:hypothetical protein
MTDVTGNDVPDVLCFHPSSTPRLSFVNGERKGNMARGMFYSAIFQLSFCLTGATKHQC